MPSLLIRNLYVIFLYFFIAFNALAIYISLTRCIYLGVFIAYILLIVLFIYIKPQKIEKNDQFKFKHYFMLFLLLYFVSYLTDTNMVSVVFARIGIENPIEITSSNIKKVTENTNAIATVKNETVKSDDLKKYYSAAALAIC